MLLFACNTIFAQQQDSTLFNSRFRIVINPLLMVSQLELGALVEYRFGSKKSVEVGGGVHPEGYTIRTGLKFYLKHGYYFESVFFYRHMILHHEKDLWDYTNKDTAQGHLDPGIILTISDGDGDGFLSVTAHDNKQVLATEFLVGRELHNKKNLINIYVGIGYRYKYRVLEEIKERTNSSLFNSFFSYGNNPTPYTPFHTPPNTKYILYDYLPSLQAGIQISISCKHKKTIPK